MNAVQIKKIKKNIRILQAQNILQDQKIDELARYMNLTATRVRLHDKQIYNLQVRMVRLEQGLQEMTDITNFHIYATHQINMAQSAVFRLQLGLGTAEANVERILEYLRVMATQKASPAVIPPVALRDLVKRIRAKLRPNPRLRLPYDPDTVDIWKYYQVMKITPVVIDKLLVILLTIPILDSTLELNVYRAHNLPAIPPGHEVAATYILEGDYFAIGKHGVYAALPSESSIQVCLESDLAICMMGQALYPTMHITWCIYALFIEDEVRIRRDCKYNLEPFMDNRAQSLGGYMWALSSIKQEPLQIRCLEETHVIQVRPPLQIVYIGNGCEGYSPSMYIPARSELSGTEEIESRRDYFLQFNYVFEPDQLVGAWWQFRAKLMKVEEAKAFVEQVEPLGTMDYSILNQRVGNIDNKYPWSLPIPPMAFAVGVGFLITLLGGVIFAIKLYRVGLTVKEARGVVTRVTTKPMSCFRAILGRTSREKVLETPQPATNLGNIEENPTAPEELDLHPVRMRDILQTVLEDERTSIKYGKYLDQQANHQRREGASGRSPQVLELEAPGRVLPKLQFIRLSPTAKAPTRATAGAIGYDLYTPFSFTLYPQDIKLVYTDIAIGVPVGHYGRVAPKSGLTLNHHITVLAGVIDPDYTGNVGVILHNLSSDTKFTRLVGEPIAQLVLEVASILPTQEVRTLPISARGPNGFGSHD